jgi:hypothetical protein
LGSQIFYYEKAVKNAQVDGLYLSRGKLLQQLGRQDEAADVLQRGIEVASRRGDLMPLREMEHRLALGLHSSDR